MSPVARRLLIAVVVLVALLVAADRGGDYVAERAAAQTIKDSQHLDSRPDVNIAGFPFLTQLAAGKFDRITVTAKDVPVGRQTQLLDISRLHVVLRGIKVARDFSRVQAASAEATATISYAELGRTLGVQLSYAGAGRVKATKTVTVAGRTVSGSVTARPELVNGALTFAATQVDGAGALGAEVTSALTKVFRLDIPFQGLPFDIRVQSLRVTPDGLLAELVGRDLTYVKN